MRQSRLRTHRKKNVGMYIFVKFFVICYLVFAGLSMVTSSTNASFTSKVELAGMIQAGTWEVEEVPEESEVQDDETKAIEDEEDTDVSGEIEESQGPEDSEEPEETWNFAALEFVKNKPEEVDKDIELPCVDKEEKAKVEISAKLKNHSDLDIEGKLKYEVHYSESGDFKKDSQRVKAEEPKEDIQDVPEFDKNGESELTFDVKEKGFYKFKVYLEDDEKQELWSEKITVKAQECPKEDAEESSNDNKDKNLEKGHDTSTEKKEPKKEEIKEKKEKQSNNNKTENKPPVQPKEPKENKPKEKPKEAPPKVKPKPAQEPKSKEQETSKPQPATKPKQSQVEEGSEPRDEDDAEVDK